MLYYPYNQMRETLECVYQRLRRKQARRQSIGTAFLIHETMLTMEELSECEKEDHAPN